MPLGASWTPDDEESRPLAMAWDAYQSVVTEAWHALLASDPEEAAVQEFLELHPALVPGGSGDIGPGGHHGSEMRGMYARPKLKGSGRDFEPDFLWVTRSSSLITPIMIEIEKPSKRWFNADERPSKHFHDAHDQLADWRTWFASPDNQSIFRETFMVFDRLEDRPISPQFVLVYGRDSEFVAGGGHRDPAGLRRKRDSLRQPDETLLTFDALRPRYDHADSVTLLLRKNRPELFAVSPTFGTGPFIAETANYLGDPAEALQRAAFITDERRQYLADRWLYWAEQERRRADSDQRIVRSLGAE